MRSGRIGRYVALAAAAALVGAGIVVAAQPSGAVHDTGLFELDGNIAHNAPAPLPYDWASLFDASGNRLVTPDPLNGPLLASTFASDAATPDQTYFTSNKDIQPIASGQQHWGCDPINNPLNKDDLLHAYAALVDIPVNAPDNAGHQVLYLGSERGSHNGTSNAGFWLLKDPSVGCSGSADFSGQHTDGDILITSDYTNGGGTQDVNVYRWTGDDANGTLVLQSSGGVCGTTAPDNACAIANAATVASPWSPTSHESNTFVEAGIDLTTLLGAQGGCFTSFLAETRSSAQLTATLKDFAGGQFNTCPQPPITTTATPGGALVAPGSAQHDVATVSAVGPRPVPTGTVSFFLCNPSQVVPTGCPTGGLPVGSTGLLGGSAESPPVSGPTDTAPGKYCWRAEYAPDAASSGTYLPSSHTNSDTECFTVVHGSPTLTTEIAVTGDNPPGLGFTTLGDTATLSGFVGSVTGETITFNLYGPFATGVTPVCTGNPVFTTTGSLNASGVATTSQTYDPTAVGTYTWRASYAGNALNDPATHACGQAAETATIVGSVVSVVKAANPTGPVSAGDPIGFDITVTNTSTVPARGVHVTDTLPGNGLDWTLDPAFPGCAITGAVGSQVLLCDLATVNPQQSVGPIHVSATTTPANCGVVSNHASVTTTNGTGGESNVASVTVNCPDLTVSKTADAATVSAGDPIGFTITAHNNGPGTAHGTTITDPLPTGPGISWTIAAQTPSGSCAIGGSTLTCSIGDFAPGATVTVHVISPTTSASCAGYDNTATATATNAPSASGSASTTVQCPAVTLTKTADATSVAAGDPIGFTVTATNAGPGVAQNVVVNDPLPTGDGISWTIAAQTPSGSCAITGGTLTCTVASLAAGANLTVHVTSPTSAASCKQYDNTASATVANQQNAPGNASATTTVQCSGLTFTKTADAASVAAGSPIGFTITANNAGPAPANGVTITDELPAGDGIDWKLDASAPATCAITGRAPTQTLTCSAVNLAAGEHESVHVTSATTADSCAIYDNTATLDARNAPSLTAHATTSVTCAPPTTPTPTPTPTPTHGTTPPSSTPPLAGTGAGPIRDELAWAIGLIVLGGVALAVARLRRRLH